LIWRVGLRPAKTGCLRRLEVTDLTGCVRIEISTNLVYWIAVGTKTVTDGSARFVHPSGATGVKRFYRVTTVPCPAEE